MLKTFRTFLATALLLASGWATAQFATSSLTGAATPTQVSTAGVEWVDSTRSRVGGPTSTSPLSCPGNSRWGMDYGGSIASCLFPDQRCEGNNVAVNWREFHLRTQYEASGCRTLETGWTSTYESWSCNCQPGGTSWVVHHCAGYPWGYCGSWVSYGPSCDTCGGWVDYPYSYYQYRGCNVTRRFQSVCNGTVTEKWSSIIPTARTSASLQNCTWRDQNGTPRSYQATTCYDETPRDSVQAPPQITSFANSTNGSAGTARFSCQGNDTWAETTAHGVSSCPLGTFVWATGEFVSRDGPWQ